jgi:hypothetical protein
MVCEALGAVSLFDPDVLVLLWSTGAMVVVAQSMGSTFRTHFSTVPRKASASLENAMLCA